MGCMNTQKVKEHTPVSEEQTKFKAGLVKKYEIKR